jgi:transposase
MMGQLSSGQERLFYSFNIEDHIPANHLLRNIDRCLDLSDLRHYSPIGRPSIDPQLMIRLLIVGYCYGIRSERRLCEEAHLNLASRWFCRLSLEDEVPNHSTFSKNRHGRFRDSSLFRWLFNEVLRRCMDAGLVTGEGFAVDASVIKADASRQRGVPGDEEVNWRDPSLHEAARDVARRIAATPQYVCSRYERKKVEMLFAHLKRILRLDRLRLRGMSGANDEFTLAAAVQNLRRLAKLTSQGPPGTG